MKEIKFLGKQLGLFLLTIFVSSLFFSILEYFGIFSTQTIHIFFMIIIIGATFLTGFWGGKKVTNKGYLAGMKLGGFIILSLLLFNTIFCGIHFKGVSILYYIGIFLLCIIGSMMGINHKKK